MAPPPPSPPSQPTRVLITGASGMLGRSLHRTLSASPYQYAVLGTGLTRASPPLRRLDLLDPAATADLLDEFRPDVVVHCAAERDPDAFEADPQGARRINVDATAGLAAECARVGSRLIYLSTSYVFDGGAVTKVKPPFRPDSTTHPLNGYGESKLAGEAAAMGVAGLRVMILRVPLLYGEDCADLSESAALATARALLPENKGRPTKVDDWALRFPTSVEDLAVVLKRMIDADLPTGIYHVSSPEGITKYGLARLQSEILNLSDTFSCVLPGDGPPSGSAPRPQCTQLDCSSTWEALGGEHKFLSLREGMERALERFREKISSSPKNGT